MVNRLSCKPRIGRKASIRMQTTTIALIARDSIPEIVNIRIRPHHLLCMLTFSGSGYSPDFIANFERIARMVASGGHTLQMVFGPDDICSPILSDPECHCRSAGVLERDRLAAEALTGLLQQPVNENESLQLSPDTLDQMRAAFARGTIRKACQGCQWSPLCDAIAKNSFSESILLRRDC